ncbi:MAG: hypothetical protein LW854_14130, partial [Rubrivivax sp.]|nr:hypothetical protein [Rubrivivax sp.]
MLRAVEEMSWSQRKELIERLQAAQGTEQVRCIVEDRLQPLPMRRSQLCAGCPDVPSAATIGGDVSTCRNLRI